MELLSSILTLVVTETRSYATYQLAQLYFILVEKKGFAQCIHLHLNILKASLNN